MATRVVEIKITGEGGNYAAEIQRMTDKTNQFNRAATQGAAQTTTAFRTMSIAVTGLQNVLGTLGVTFGVGAITAFLTSALKGVAVLQDLSDQTGITANNLQALRLAGIATGQGIEEISTGIVRLQKALIESRTQGTEPANKGLLALKLSAAQLAAAMADPNELITIFSQKLAEIPNQAERNAIAMQLAGRSGFRLSATLLDLAANQEKYRQGAVLTSDQVKKMDDGLDKLSQTWQKVKDSTALAVIELAKWLGLMERSKTEQVNQEIARNGDALRIQVEQLKRLNETKLTGPTGPRFEAERQQAIKDTTKRIFDLMDAQEKLNQQLKEADIKPKLPPPGPAAIDPKLQQQQLEALEQAKTKLLALQLATAQAARASGDYTVDVRSLALALIEQERVSALLVVTNNKALPALKALINAEAEQKIKQFEAAEATLVHKNALQEETGAARAAAQAEAYLAATIEGSARDDEIKKKRTLDAIERERQLADLQADRLVIVGATTVAEETRLRALIANLQQLKAIEDAVPGGGDSSVLSARIINAQMQLEKLGQTSIDIAGEVSRVVTDITSAVINGTLKWADIGKSILASFVRLALEQFTGFLRKMQESARAAQIVGGGAAGGLLPGSQASAGGIVQGASGGGGFFGSLAGLFDTGTGIGTSTIGGVLGAGIGGLALSSAFGGSGLQNIFSSVGSIAGNLINGLGASGAITTALTGALGAGIAGFVGNFLLPGIGSIIGFLIGGLFADIPNPSVWVKTIIKFYYDALTTSFNAVTTATILRFTDIKGGAAAAVLAEHQRIMDTVAKQFVDILNAFPVAVHDNMLAVLEDANSAINYLLGNKKYTEGGSRNLRQELDDLMHHEAPAAFFYALRETIGVGLSETLKLAGFDFSDIIGRNFAAPTDALARNPLNYFGGRVDAGYSLGTDKDANDKFLNAVTKMAQFAGSLGAISPRGVQPFLTAADNARLEAELRKVFESPTTEAFGTAVEDMIERIKPLSEFLAKAVSDASNIFGRGLIAALEAATGSQANTAFLKSLGEGAKEIIFQGITEAFIASAQFTDLLAPIQRVIREFTQEAISTGETPDIDAFRRALLPGIEDLTTRAETLRPLIEELQKLGLDVRRALGLLAGGGAFGDVNITIEGGLNDERDGANFARRIEEILRPSLPPPT